MGGSASGSLSDKRVRCTRRGATSVHKQGGDTTVYNYLRPRSNFDRDLDRKFLL